MSLIDTLTERNAVFAAQRFDAALKIIPSRKTMIIGCVDPEALLGLALGEAAVLRNIGGRITPEAVQVLDLLGTVAENSGGKFGPGWNLIVLHHTDCGIKRLVGAPGPLSTYLGCTADELEARHVTDPHASVAFDVELLRANPAMPGTFVLSGLVYDVATGKVETVVPPAPLRTV